MIEVCRPYWKAEGFMSAYDRRLTYRKTFVFPSCLEARDFVRKLSLSARYNWDFEKVTIHSCGCDVEKYDETAASCQGVSADGEDGTWAEKGR